ncbi:hypothetical protein ACWC09_26360 [Streptomyces sp. NPDC001617]
MKQDRTTTLPRAPHPGDFVHQVPARTSNFHFAEMRCAEATAARLHDDRAGHLALARMTGVPWDQADQAAAARDSYYLLAAAYRNAGRRRERRENRAAAWADFRDRPVYIAGVYASSYARDVRRLARSIRRAVSV